MKPHELLEMCSLDAMGLLDNDEREAFERAFRAAPPALQAQIRREQTRLASMDSLLPAVEPPLGLKAKVMAAVREAMQTMNTRGKAGAPMDVVATIRPSMGVNRLWRVGALGAAAAAIALAFTTLQLKRDYEDISSTANSNKMIDVIREQFGPGFDRVMLAEDTTIVQMRSDAEASGQRTRPTGLIFVDRKASTARLVTQGLASNEEYELTLVDKDGNTTKTVLSFRSSPAQMEYRTLTGISLENIATIALTRVGDATPLLVGRVTIA